MKILKIRPCCECKSLRNRLMLLAAEAQDYAKLAAHYSSQADKWCRLAQVLASVLADKNWDDHDLQKVFDACSAEQFGYDIEPKGFKTVKYTLGPVNFVAAHMCTPDKLYVGKQFLSFLTRSAGVFKVERMK